MILEAMPLVELEAMPRLSTAPLRGSPRPNAAIDNGHEERSLVGLLVGAVAVFFVISSWYFPCRIRRARRRMACSFGEESAVDQAGMLDTSNIAMAGMRLTRSARAWDLRATVKSVEGGIRFLRFANDRRSLKVR